MNISHSFALVPCEDAAHQTHEPAYGSEALLWFLGLPGEDGQGRWRRFSVEGLHTHLVALRTASDLTAFNY